MSQWNTKWYKFGVLINFDTTKLEDIRVMNGNRCFKTVKCYNFGLVLIPLLH